MEKLFLTRESTSDNGTFGRIYRDAKIVCHTCELPWKNNERKISCIPQGAYTVTRYASPTKGNVFLLHDVPNRDMIEIHVGNTIKDIIGCIAVGEMPGNVSGLPAVINSKATMAKLLTDLPKTFYLEISGVCG